MGFREAEADRVVVEFLQFHRLAATAEVARHNRSEFLVLQDVLVPEQDVVGGEGLAIGPADPAPEPERVGSAAVLDLPPPRQVRQDAAAHGVPADEPIVGQAGLENPDVARPRGEPSPRAAIGPALIGRDDDERVFRQALADGRQLARSHPPGEPRCIVEVPSAGLRPLLYPMDTLRTGRMAFGRSDRAEFFEGRLPGAGECPGQLAQGSGQHREAEKNNHKAAKKDRDTPHQTSLHHRAV